VRLDVACAVEGEEYVAHCAAMLHSVLARNRAHEIRVHYMHGPDLEARDRDRLTELVEREGGAIDFLYVPDRDLDGLPTIGFTKKATWYRIFLPELLTGVDRILYLDADLLVLEDMAPLWALDLTGHWVGAVTNVFQDNHLWHASEIGLSGPEAYFNAGVLLMNLAEMRRDGRTRALFDFGVENAERIELRDQDALNVVLGERRLRLHPRWNVMNSFHLFPKNARVLGRWKRRQAIRRPAIRHFEGPDALKPWHPDCEQTMYELYRAHRAATPWQPASV
jgi:lipopolysaccharide biosynthesis glycosyltransferase